MNAKPTIQLSVCGVTSARQPDAGAAGQGVIGQRRHKDARNDGVGPSELGGEHEGQELRLVADLRDGHQGYRS
jgi:hypothetical protein